MRETYILSEETEQAFNGAVSRIAKEAEKTPQHFYNILAGFTADPFAPFKSLFRILCRVHRKGAKIYLDSLSLEYELTEPRKVYHKPVSTLTGNIGKEFAEFAACVISNKPISQQLKELEDIELEAKAMRAALIDQYNTEHCTERKQFSAQAERVN